MKRESSWYNEKHDYNAIHINQIDFQRYRNHTTHQFLPVWSVSANQVSLLLKNGMTRNQPKPPETTQNQPKPALPTRNQPKRDLPSLKQTEQAIAAQNRFMWSLIMGIINYFLSWLQMAAEVIPPQMSKVDGIIKEITTAINKNPLISELLFFCYMASSNTIQLNQGDPCVVLPTYANCRSSPIIECKQIEKSMASSKRRSCPWYTVGFML